MHTYFLSAPRDRPDFRQVIAYLWNDGKNVDTEGNSYNPASRTWTSLYIQNREQEVEVVEVYQFQKDPLILCVESELDTFAARVAFYLATYCGGNIGVKPDELIDSPDKLLQFVRPDFDTLAGLQRAAKSQFARSTEENPFPNLDAESMLKAKAALRLS